MYTFYIKINIDDGKREFLYNSDYDFYTSIQSAQDNIKYTLECAYNSYDIEDQYKTLNEFIERYKDDITITIIGIFNSYITTEFMAKELGMKSESDVFPDSLSIEEKINIYNNCIWYRKYFYTIESLDNIYMSCIEDTFVNGGNISRDPSSYIVDNTPKYKLGQKFTNGKDIIEIKQLPDAPYSKFYWCDMYVILYKGEEITIGEQSINQIIKGENYYGTI